MVSTLLTLSSDLLFSKFAFKCNSYRYTAERLRHEKEHVSDDEVGFRV
jgi:hypothetical protein